MTETTHNSYYREAFEANNTPRAFWQPLLSDIEALQSQDGLTDCLKRAQSALQNDGATFFRDDTGKPSARAHWPLDPIPRLIHKDEWTTLTAGFQVRTQLFNSLLKDLYTEQACIKSGTLPPEAIYAHSGLLRPCINTQITAEHGLFFHCLDMMRDQLGNWIAMNDAFQLPKGLGFALENREVVSRLFPSAFHETQVQRLGAFFNRIWQVLTSLKSQSNYPSIVILTKGQQSRDYFEHSFLANLYGIPLLQPQDLLVRHEQVWMKTFDGLLPVDIIIRFVEDNLCDPVELDGSSRLGVCGLLGAIRAQNVKLINPLGISVLENPVLYKYMDQLADFYGLAPPLPSIQTFWFADNADKAHIEQHLNELIIKPTFTNEHFSGVRGADLTSEQQQALLKKMHAAPHQYVAQPQLSASVTPSLINQQLVEQPSVTRLYAFQMQNEHLVLPSGIAQVSQETDTCFIRLRANALSKDVWVVGDQQDTVGSKDDALNVQSTYQAESSIASRVIENFYILGRDAERAQTLLRLIRIYLLMLTSEEGLSDNASQRFLLAIHTLTEENGLLSTKESTTNLLTLDDIITPSNGQSAITLLLEDLLQAAEASKEMLSIDTLRVISTLRGNIDALGAGCLQDQQHFYHQCLEPLITNLLALSGVGQEQMRGPHWQFMMTGKRITRIKTTLQMVDTFFVPYAPLQDQHAFEKAFLMTFELFITFRRQYHNAGNLEALLQLMFLEHSNPRSILFQLEALMYHLDIHPFKNDDTPETPADERMLIDALNTLKQSNSKELIALDQHERLELKAFILRQIEIFETLSLYINDLYFEHSMYPRQLNAKD